MPGDNCKPLRALRVPKTLFPGHILNARSQLYATSCSSCSQNTISKPHSDFPHARVDARTRAQARKGPTRGPGRLELATSAQGNRYVLDADTRLRSWGSGGALRIFKTVVLWAPRLERGHGAREEAAEAPRGPNLSLSQQKENHALRTQMLGSGRGSRAGPHRVLETVAFWAPRRRRRRRRRRRLRRRRRHRRRRRRCRRRRRRRRRLRLAFATSDKNVNIEGEAEDPSGPMIVFYHSAIASPSSSAHLRSPCSPLQTLSPLRSPSTSPSPSSLSPPTSPSDRCRAPPYKQA